MSFNTASNSFSTNTKVQLVAGSLADNLDYVKASVSKMSQGDFKGKKYGRSYKLYIPDAGVVREGLTAVPDEVTEVETEITLNNFNTAVTINAWQDLGSIEDFTKEIAKPRGEHLARAMQQALVKGNVYKSIQAVVAASATFDALSEASAKLGELAVGGDVVSFMHPTVMGKISASGLANFIPSQEAAEIYSKNYIGEYAGASQIRLATLPVISVGATAPAGTTLALTPVTDTDSNTIGFETVDTITGTNLIVGAAFSVAGLKVVDQSGIQTDQDAIVIVTEVNAAGTSGKITPLRITVDGYGYNNPNAWLPNDGTDDLVFTSLLTANYSYYVGQVRTKECFAFDSYKFGNLPGTDNEEVATVGGVTVKMSISGNNESLEKFIRLDAPHAGGIWDSRGSVTVYIKK